MDEILEILSGDARISNAEIAKLTGKSADSVKKKIQKYTFNGITQSKNQANNVHH